MKRTLIRNPGMGSTGTTALHGSCGRTARRLRAGAAGADDRKAGLPRATGP